MLGHGDDPDHGKDKKAIVICEIAMTFFQMGVFSQHALFAGRADRDR